MPPGADLAAFPLLGRWLQLEPVAFRTGLQRLGAPLHDPQALPGERAAAAAALHGLEELYRRRPLRRVRPPIR